MSAFNVVSPFDAPNQKQALIDRLMQQYQESATRAQGLQRTIGVAAPRPLSGGITPQRPVTPLTVTTPRQVMLPQAHPFMPVRVGGV